MGGKRLTRRVFATEKGVDDHAEIIGLRWLQDQKIELKNVRRIYSELEPCSLETSMCKFNLQRNLPNVRIEYSFDYPGTKLVGAAKRRLGLELRKKAIQRIIK